MMKARLGQKGLLSDDRRPKACFEEGGKEYRAENPEKLRVLRYHIDGAMITCAECCDYGLGLPERDTVILIELKGSDIKKAARQILSTIKALSPSIVGYNIHGRIVLARTPRPDIRSTPVIELERELARRHGLLKRECKVMTEKVGT